MDGEHPQVHNEPFPHKDKQCKCSHYLINKTREREREKRNNKNKWKKMLAHWNSRHTTIITQFNATQREKCVAFFYVCNLTSVSKRVKFANTKKANTKTFASSFLLIT